MMRKRLLILIGLLCCMCIHAQIIFNHLSSPDQLSNYSVMSIYQDERGFLWIGTQRGLNLYDGRYIKTFTVKVDSKNSIHDNIITKVSGDGKGHVFAFSANGIDKIDIRTEQITQLVSGPTSAMAFVNGILYYAIGNRIFTLDKSKKIKLIYTLPSTLSAHSLTIGENRIIIGTDKDGLFLYDTKYKQSRHLLNGLFIETIYIDKKGSIWIGTQRHGYYIYSNDKLVQGTTLGKDNDVRVFCEDNVGNMWIGTMNGLYQRDKQGELHVYTANGQKDGLSHNSVWSLLKDKQGNIWVGSYFGGIDFFNPENHLFKHYKNIVGNTTTQPVVGEMVEDKHQNLWISTDGNGLNCLNRYTGVFSNISTANGLGHNNVRSLWYDTKNDLLYIGMHMGGMDCLNISNRQLKHCLTSPSAVKYIPSKVVNNIAQWKDQLILASRDGIFRYDINSGIVSPITNNETIFKKLGGPRFIYVDKKGRLWSSGGEDGIYILDLKDNSFHNYSYKKREKGSLNSNNVNYIFEDSKDRMWMCTGEAGLQIFNDKDETFQNLPNPEHFIVSNCTFSMCEIGDDLYVVETDKGFYIYNHKTNRYLSYTNQNELPLVSVFQESLYKVSDGTVFLGGINGLISFNPNELIKQKGDYDIYPSRLLVNGGEILPNDNSGILKYVISYTDRIELNSSQSNFSIEYSIMDFIPNHRKELEYYLEGYSKDWMPATMGNLVSFNNLDSGNYTLKVRLKGQQKCSVLHIHILPPFYLTVWAYIIYAILTVIIILFLNRTYKRRIRLQEQVKYEQKRVEYVEEINQSKMRFFTNISHEFRTPLTVIIGNADNLVRTSGLNPGIYNKILSIFKASTQLQELISELLDFRKQEQGQMELHVTRCNMVHFLSESIYLFAEYAQGKGIDITYDAVDKDIEAWIDCKQIQKVINNLVSNALKHTNKGDSIRMKLRQNEHEIIISVQDTGCGIPQAELNNIFRRFYQLDISSVGTGIGLALTKSIVELHHGFISVDSSEGKGSTFTITLQKGNEWCTPENLSHAEATLDETIQTKEIAINYLPETEEHLDENKGQPHIVIVEDNEELRLMLKDLFCKDYQVTLAADGEEGWQKVSEELPELVLTDVVMPRKNGIELCKQIKENFDTCHIPVVMLTARVSIEHNLEGLNTGADDYITKPFNTSLLLLRCNNIIRNRIMLQQKFAKQTDASVETLITNNKDKKFMEDVMAYINTNLGNMEFNIEDIASELCISRSKFFAKLKSISGQTPHEFLSGIRMKKAIALLENCPDMNITEIGMEVGFGSLRYFSKVFKETMGCTPMEYRKTKEELK